MNRKFLNWITTITLTLYGNVENHHGAKGRIGILYDPVHHRIVKVYKYTPAAEGGLHAGDIVKHINAADITGPSYTKVNLTIKRGNQIFTIELERIPNELVDTHQVQDEEKNTDENVDLDIDLQIPPETG